MSFGAACRRPLCAAGSPWHRARAGTSSANRDTADSAGGFTAGAAPELTRFRLPSSSQFIRQYLRRVRFSGRNARRPAAGRTRRHRSGFTSPGPNACFRSGSRMRRTAFASRGCSVFPPRRRSPSRPRLPHGSSPGITIRTARFKAPSAPFRDIVIKLDN